MKIGLKLILSACFGVAFLQAAVAADDKPALKDEKEKVSYAIGMNVGNNLKRGGYEIDVEVLAAAIRDIMAGTEPKMNEAQAREALNGYKKN